MGYNDNAYGDDVGVFAEAHGANMGFNSGAHGGNVSFDDGAHVDDMNVAATKRAPAARKRGKKRISSAAAAKKGTVYSLGTAEEIVGGSLAAAARGEDILGRTGRSKLDSLGWQIQLLMVLMKFRVLSMGLCSEATPILVSCSYVVFLVAC